MGRLLLFSEELSNTTHLKTQLPPSPERIAFNFKRKANYQRVDKLSRFQLLDGSSKREKDLCVSLSLLLEPSNKWGGSTPKLSSGPIYCYRI